MTTRPRWFRHSATGSVAVEMAIVLPLLIMLLTLPIFFARIFWFYSVGHKAAHDAARYLSAVTQAEMRTPGADSAEAKVKATALWIANAELAEIKPITDNTTVEVRCDGGTVTTSCGSGAPAMVYVGVDITLHDSIFSNLLETYLDNTYFTLTSSVTMRYVGN